VALRARQPLARRPAPEPVEELQQPALKLFGAEPFEVREPKLKAAFDGLDLQAATAFEAHERVAVERFCRYGMRGPLALNRLSQGPKETLLYQLKTPKPDGTTHLVPQGEASALLSPRQLLERLARLVPLPDKHLVRYHGVLAPAATWRAQVVPAKPVEGTVLPRPKGRRIAWADLLRRVFALEILLCACGGQRRIIAAIDEGPVARKILQHLGLPAVVPAVAPARIDQGHLWQTGPPPEPPRVAPPPDEFDQRDHLDAA